MQQILLFSLLGLGSGALIAGIALGVVLTYRGSGIINLATGGVAMFAGYAFWALTTDLLHLPTVPALLISLVIVLAVGAAIELVAFRPLRTAPPLAKLVSSLGCCSCCRRRCCSRSAPRRSPSPACSRRTR
ncbi:MAG: ABC transporter permease subunit [Solirubrobacteraceae bacterium]